MPDDENKPKEAEAEELAECKRAIAEVDDFHETASSLPVKELFDQCIADAEPVNDEQADIYLRTYADQGEVANESLGALRFRKCVTEKIPYRAWAKRVGVTAQAVQKSVERYAKTNRLMDEVSTGVETRGKGGRPRGSKSRELTETPKVLPADWAPGFLASFIEGALSDDDIDNLAALRDSLHESMARVERRIREIESAPVSKPA